MKCPQCGREMPDGHLLCGHCGEEIQIVPDFEPEIENSIRETLSTLVSEQEEDFGDGGSGAEKARPLRVTAKRRRIVLAASLFLTIALAALALYVYHIQTVEYRIARAREYAAGGDYGQAIACLQEAYRDYPEVAELLFLEADYHYLQEDDGAAITALMRIIDRQRTPRYDEADVEEAYGKIVTIYENRKEYGKINELLLSCDSERIVSRFQGYLAFEPEFSYVEGSYAEVIPLKLSSNTAGTIYYTLDGTKPSRNSKVYTAPLFLETGEYTVSAFFVNDYGIESGIVTKTYVINLAAPNAPEVELYSGEYTQAMMIAAEPVAGVETYYTTDGTEPTADSVPYTGPIPMPLGKTLFQFVNVSEEGIASEVTTRTFTLRLPGAIPTETAVANLVGRLVATGYLLDASGKNPRQSGNLSYQFSSVVRVGEEQDYYTINEYYDDGTGILSRTDKVFLVQVYTGEPARLGYDENGEFVANPV